MSNTIVEVIDSATVVDAQVVEVIVELSGEQGPAGAPGSATIVQESEPISGMVAGDLWFNPLNSVLSVYSNGAWTLESQDDGYF
jgi:hypothetical protein